MATYAPCSCGVENCPELGWPHEWDPIAAGDNCIVVPPPIHLFQVGAQVVYSPSETTPHKVREPYVRHGSGYACAVCVERFEPAPSPTNEAPDHLGGGAG